MQYMKPQMSYWDLEEEDIIVTSLGNQESDESTGDFNWEDINWGF